MTLRFSIEVRDCEYRDENGATFSIYRHGDDNTIQVAIVERIHHDKAAVLMGERGSLSLGAEMCSAARRAAKYDLSPIPHPTLARMARLGVKLPPIVYTEHTWDAEATYRFGRSGEGRVDLHWAAPLPAVLVVVHDLTASDRAGAWFDAEKLMNTGGQLCAESRRCGSAEE